MSKDLEAIKDHCGLAQTPIYKNKLSGGDINEVFLIEAEQKLMVVKKNSKDRFPRMFEKEANALRFYLEHTASFYPKPIQSFQEGSHQFLLLEYVKKGKNTSEGQKNLGVDLAKQHRVSSEKFGWNEDNYIGSLVQSNDCTDSWAEFYASQRILAQAKSAYDQKIVGRSFIQSAERYCNHLGEIFPVETPSMLHGDLWGGNYFIAENDVPFFYDPAAYFGHREIDIAMTLLFGGFSDEFYRSYNSTFPLEKGWENRVPHGQLYPNLVHLNLFGPSYLDAITTILDRF